MKLLKLTQKGIAHYIVPLVIIVAVAIGGIAYIAIDHAATCVTYNYGYGGSGSCVGYIQTLANWKSSVSPKLTVDNQYGSLTEAAIKQVQKAYSLPQDGIVGSKTWLILCSPTSAFGNNKAFSGSALTAYNNAGCSSIVAPPPKPYDMTAYSVSSSKVNLFWVEDKNLLGNYYVDGYQLYRDGDLICTGNSCYQDTGLTPSTLYHYYVKAYNDLGFISASSATVSVTTLR